MPKTDVLGPQEAETINEQKWKQLWWTPCIVAYFQKQTIIQNLLTFFGLMYQNVIVLVKIWHIFQPLQLILALLAKTFYTVANDHTVLDLAKVIPLYLEG